MIAQAKGRNGAASSTSSMAFSTSATKAADDSLLSFPRDQHRRDAWQAALDGPLLEIACNPERFAEDDLVQPSPPAISSAMEIAQFLRDHGNTGAPRAIVPSGDGGIFFEWGQPGRFYGALEVKEDGSAVHTLSRNSTIISRQQILF